MSRDTVRLAQPDSVAEEGVCTKGHIQVCIAPDFGMIWIGARKTSQPEHFGLYDQVTKRTWWMPRQ